MGTPADDDLWSMFSGWDSASLALLAFLMMAAVSVFWFGSRRLGKERSGNALRPRGRGFADHGTRHFGAAWRARATRLEGADPTPIATASAGAVRLVATIVKSSGSLGGPPARACVWRNRAGARPDSAVGAEVIVVADESGHCGVEGLERARVTAPAEKAGVHYEWISLYVGDRVELLGHFAPERVAGVSDDVREVVYGTLGTDGPLEIRLVHRPHPLPATTDDNAPLPEDS